MNSPRITKSTPLTRVLMYLDIMRDEGLRNTEAFKKGLAIAREKVKAGKGHEIQLFELKKWLKNLEGGNE